MSDDLRTPTATTDVDPAVKAEAFSPEPFPTTPAAPTIEAEAFSPESVPTTQEAPTIEAAPVPSVVTPTPPPAPTVTEPPAASPSPPQSMAGTVYPRSPQKRLQAQQQGVSKGIRSQPLAPAPRRPEPVPLPEPQHIGGPWRWRWPIALLALLAWGGAYVLLTTNISSSLPNLGSPRRVFVLGWALASMLTFAPMQWRLALSGLTWQGVLGWTLLAFLFAWAPPPTGNLLSLPDLPGYLLLFLAVFYATASAVTPLVFLVGQRLFSQRLQRLDARRARRQGYEAGLLAVAVLGLANLSILRWWTGLLLVIVFLLLETLFLSQVRPEG